uniref:Uncharacterized protein n=1 Tax=Flavobacterium columnare TaxID=996 RepID=A0AA94JNX5_9FLAO
MEKKWKKITSLTHFLLHFLLKQTSFKSKDKKILLYCHLDSVKVTKGSKVKHNDILGISGSTDNADSVFDEKGNLIHGIYSKYYHIHIEAATNYCR